LQNKKHIRYEHLPLETRDGRRIAVEFISNVYTVNHHKVIQCNIRDITKRKRAEMALRRSEANYRSLIQGATYGIFRCCQDGKFLTVNPALVTMLGYGSEADLMAANLVSDLNPDSDKGTQLLRQYRQVGRLDGVEVEWKRKDGTLVAVRLSGRTISGEPGEPECFEVIAEDLGERKRLEEQLRQMEKMETVGRLAGGVAHDFNNLLTIISGFSQLLLDRIEVGDPRRSYVDEIQKAEERAASLTRQLLALGRRQVLLPQVLDLNEVVTKMDKMLRPLLGEDIELLIVQPPDLGRVKADPGQIEQVMLNLAVNARDAMPGGGKLTLETANIDLDESYALNHAEVTTGPYVLLAVSDTGCGMDAETQSHLFEPFFTTKEKGKGTGLGLATSYGIIQQSGGYLWFYSEPGRGTTFKVYLPRVQEVPEPVAVNQAQAGPAVGSETVLLVEDETSVRLLVRGVLEARGYTVLEASRADEALRICQQHPGPIQLLLTDVVMPQTMGPALAESLLVLRPKMKVLYMSGYTDHAVFGDGTLLAGISFLQKPFTPETLAQKVRRVLDEAQSATE
jgi:PAS domain S-box-containing protein